MKLLSVRFPLSSFLALALAIFLPAGTVRTGSLDPTFGTGGKFTIGFPDATSFYRSFGFRVFYQPGDRIVGAGTFTRQGADGQHPGVMLVGLTSAGVLDPTFGGTTAGRTEDWNGAAFTGLQDVVMLQDGKIIRLSQFLPLGQFPDARVVRTTTNGSQDGTFSTNVNVGPPNTNTIPLNAEILPSGKIMLLVFAQTSPESHHLFRLNADGSRDSTFGINGDKLLNQNRLPGLWVYAMRALPNGKTMIAGSLGNQFNNSTEIFVARFDSDGNLDASFGRFGIVRYVFGAGATGNVNDMIIDANGRCTLVGAINNPDPDVFMMRLSHRGKPDATFGVRGVVITDITPGGRDLLSSITLATGGKLVVAGEASPTAGSPENFLVARYSEGGVLEAHTRTEFTPGQFASASGVTIQPDGKILVIGSTYNPATAFMFSSMWAFARYTNITNDLPREDK
jgi:uncharacterized delta-60 repeat protein